MIAGGADVITHFVNRSCKVYDVINNISCIANMVDHGSLHSAISLNDVVYSVAGCNGESLKTAECYDAIINQ